MRIIAIGLYLLSGLWVYVGTDKILNYDNSRLGSVNAYVGGDAYNYIINASLFSGYMALALVCAVLGSTLLLLRKMDSIHAVLADGESAGDDGSKGQNVQADVMDGSVSS